MTATITPFPPAPTFPHFPAPVHFERADTHARLVLSQAQELLLRLVADAALNSQEIDGRALAECIRAHMTDLAGELSAGFGMAAEGVSERDE
jgi:hypothetical protein